MTIAEVAERVTPREENPQESPLNYPGRIALLRVDSVVSLEVSAGGETAFTLPLSGVTKNNNEIR